MSVRNRDWGWVEYLTAADGFGQQLWALAWQAENYASIRPGWTFDLAGLVVTTPAGGTVRLTYDLTYETALQADADNLHEQLLSHLTSNETDDTQNYDVV